MKIAFVVTYVPPTYIGGGETYIYYLSKYLAEMGNEIDVYASPITQNPDWKWDHANFIPCQELFKISNTPIMPTQLLKLLLGSNYDVVHSEVPQGYSCEVAVTRTLLRKTPSVITFQGDIAHLDKLHYRLYFKLLQHYTLKYTNKIIVATKAVTQSSLTLAKFRDKIVNIPLGVDITTFSLKNRKKYRQEVRSRYGISENNIVVAFAGGLNSARRFKRPDILLKAFAKTFTQKDNAKVFIIGDGDLRRDYERLAKELNISNEVVFTGFLSHDELSKYLSASDMFVLPSLTQEETFSMALIEAARCGCLTICFDTPGPNEVCGSVGGIVMNVDKPIKNLSNAMRDAVKKGKYKSEYVEYSRKARRYGWDNIANETYELYKTLS